MPITKSEDGYVELSNTARLAVSQGNDSGFKEKIKRFLGLSVRIPKKSAEAYLEGNVVNDFVPENLLSGGPGTQPCSSSAVIAVNPELNKAVPPPPVNLDGADLMARNHRSRVGGKGQFLSVMTEAGLPVPPFQVIEHSALQAIDDVVIEPELLATFHPDGIDASQLQPVTLGSLKEGIPTMDRINQEKWLDALGKLLISDDFLPQVANQPIARNIRTLHQRLQADGSNQPVIIRSSGLTEDGFGDTQAGKYNSCLHSGGNILKSCLKVLASGYQPALCPDGTPQPMALIMQSYLDCRFGGVALSHTSLQDDTLQIEYAPGQPRGAVAGTNSLKPHRYQIKRNGANPIQWSRGEVTSYFALKKTAEGFTEEKHEGPSAEELPEDIPEQLKRHIVQLENLLGCPVDVEFAVDQQDRLFLVQVRPVTALPGAASFSGNPPNQPLCAGELVSEGLATGEACYVDKPPDDPLSIPKGAIIHAVNAAPWMLKPAIINRAGGYVFKNGGNNDHIAIMLKQSGKPCLRSDSPFTGEKPRPSSRVTLLAGSFDQTIGAYLVDGDQTTHWSMRYTKPTLDYDTALARSAANKPTAPTFKRVEQGFLWLHAQNQRVLNYFLRGQLFDLCLASGHNKLLSMLPDRVRVLQALKSESEKFLQDTQCLLDGYERFLQLHNSGWITKKKYLREVDHFLKNVHPLKDRLTTIKSRVLDQVNKITDPMVSHQELPDQPIDFEQWLNDGVTLINELQQLNQPDTVVGVHSAHDLVFYIHKQFIAALEPVASLSKQGVVKRSGKLNISNFISDESESLLTERIKNALNSAINAGGFCTVFNLPTACIANIILGMHACTLAMFEHGDGGKGRKLQLTFSDDMSSEQQGKLKRFWFLTHAIQLTLAGKNVQNMTTRINPATNTLTIALHHIESTDAMKAGFLTLTTLLAAIRDIDVVMDSLNTLGQPGIWQWDFATVEKMITESRDDPTKNDFTFKTCLSYQGLSKYCRKHEPLINSVYSMEYRIFFNAGKSFDDTMKAKTWDSDQHLLNGINQWLSQFTEPLQPDAERVKKELAFILLATHSDYYETLYTFVKKKYPKQSSNNDFLKKLCCYSTRLFTFLPLKLRDDITFAADVIMSSENFFNHAGSQVKNDKPTVIAMLQRFPSNLRYVSNAMKDDSDVVLSAVNAQGFTLAFAGESQKSNYDIVTAAIENNPMAFESAGIPLKQDKNFVLALVRKIPDLLRFIKPEYQDQEIALTALKGNSNMDKYISEDIINDPEFLLRAKDYLPKVRNYHLIH